ncbi:VMAP-C domain-containing protein [Streptomyces sp. NPDC054933]
MGWFRYANGDDSAGVHGAFVSVLREHDRLAAGGGVLLTERHLLTCAHVVNVALGKELLESADPGPVRIGAVFPGSGTRVPHEARVAHWVPPRRTRGGLDWSGDLAVLELEDPAPVVPPRWSEMVPGQGVRAWHGGGHAATFVEVTVKECDGWIGYVDGELSGAAIGPGYSGGPLWSEREGAMVGLVAAQLQAPDGPLAAHHVVRRGWAIPWQAVRAELESAGAGPLLASADDGAGDAGSVPHQLLPPLAALLSDPAERADKARRLAEQCGLHALDDGSAPTYEELATVLTEHPRSLASLTEVLAPTAHSALARDAIDTLHATGPLVAGARLLSYAEHHRLLVQLKQQAKIDPALLPGAARGALAYAELPEPVRAARIAPQAVDDAVGALEELGDSGRVPAGTPRVPALLRVAEYVAAALRGEACDELRGWSDQVATRLGIHPAALAERRADAEAWASRRDTDSGRTVVRLTRRPGDPPGGFRCTVWRMAPDGTAARVSTGEDRPFGGPEIARLVRDAVAPDETEAPLVEVVVDRDALQLPVDEWREAEPDDLDPYGIFAPAALGADFRVVLRCPELRRRSPTGAADLRRRWAGCRTEETLVIDELTDDVRALKDMLNRTRQRSTGRVVLHGSPARRAHLLQVCLFMGVPVVLWDRAAAGREHAYHLQEIDSAGPLDSLPERVRDFRVDVYADPESTVRPSLVWEDPDRSLPGELRLADPVAMTEEK